MPMSVKEAAKALGISQRLVYEAIQRRTLQHYRYGEKIVIEAADLEAYRESHRVPVRGVRKAAAPTVRVAGASRYFAD